MFLAEVSDKIWLWEEAAFFGAVLGLLTLVLVWMSAAIRWWVALVPLALSFALACFMMSIRDDTAFEQAVIREQGPLHYVRVTSAFFVAYFVTLSPAIWVLRAARGVERRVDGRCAACSYELAGLPGAICPECGTANLAGDGVTSAAIPVNEKPTIPMV